MTLKEVVRRMLRTLVASGARYYTFKWGGSLYKIFKDGRLIKLGRPKEYDLASWADHKNSDD